MTPDSFTDGGKFLDPARALEHAEQLIADGASIIDVGGESTRPGAMPVDVDEEWARIEPVVGALADKGICVSVDTRHAYVAQKAIAEGASIINDVSGFTDPDMANLAANADVGLVVMHMQGIPENMQDAPTYSDVVTDVKDFLVTQCKMLEKLGVEHDRICVDPGPGFGKDFSQTIELMRNIHEFRHLGYPVMAAVSRKSYITHAYKLDKSDMDARDAASAEEALLACELGATVVRTHNVKVTAEALSNLRPYVILSAGSNVALVAEPGEEDEAKMAQINLAVGKLCQLPDSQIIDIAPFYKSEPAYKEDQDDFINTAILLRTGIPPLELLDYLHAIEGMLGRVRHEENGPRTLDLDIVDYQMYAFEGERLTLPHPRATERDFVVKPILDILPGHVLANGHAIDELCEESRVGRSWKI